MADDALKDLPRLDDTAMSPCVCCKRQLLETGLPIFFRIEAKQCGLDGPAIRQHVGLAMSMGGGLDGLALASVLGPGIKPVIIMETITTFNVCHDCASARGVGLLAAIGEQWEADRRAKGLSVPGDEDAASG
jgi:hypothetical protein